MKTVAIIGGGFSGTMTAVNLARLAKQPVQIHLINSGYPLGRGVAYGTRRPEHLLNVAARNMSALAEQPSHFLDWLQTRHEYADVSAAMLREQFMPRRVFGDYVQSLLHFQQAQPGPAYLKTIADEVLDVVPGVERTTVVMRNHRTLEADCVVLAVGNQPPAEASLPAGALEMPRVLSNPWKGWEAQLTDPRENVILLGAGLTMIDVFLTLRQRGWQGTIFAVSRTGLLPLSHFRGIEYPDFPREDPSSLGLDALTELVQEHCGRLRQMGANPAIVVDKLRPYTQRIWQKLSLADKQRFCREQRTRWNITRHRVAPSIHEELTNGMASGALQAVQGKVLALSCRGDRLYLDVQCGQEQKTIEASWLLNCTGPQESYQGSSILFQNLFDRGLVKADPLDMGILADANFRVIDGGGYACDFLFALGPVLKGMLWETTAVPELRLQAQRVAEAILSRLEGAAAPEWFAEMFVEVLEYSI